MNKLIRVVQLSLLVNTLATLTFANAATNSSHVKVTEVEKFIEAAEKEREERGENLRLAWYIKDRFTTLDTMNNWNNLMAQYEGASLELAYQANLYKEVPLGKDLQRRLKIITSEVLNYPNHPRPLEEDKAEKLKIITTELNRQHAENTICLADKKLNKPCLSVKEVEEKMASSQNELELKSLWLNWHNNLTVLKPLYQQQLQLNNEGAQRFGFSSKTEMKLSYFEMPSSDLIDELDQTWLEIEPLYRALLSHVRDKLTEKYGTDIIKPNQPLPAHLLGSISTNDLSSLYSLVQPKNSVKDRGYNIAEKLKEKPELDLPTMLHNLEKYMESMGFAPFKKSLYEYSQYTKPEHYDAACDSTAWWLPGNNEARIGGCWDVNERNFFRFNTTGLITPTYHRASLKEQPYQYGLWPAGLFRGSARSLQYAYTPDYLTAIGMLEEVPDESLDLGHFMKLALSTISSLPYKLAIIKWQEEVSSGKIEAQNYNKRWWQLREKYQGIRAPMIRDAEGFDAGAIVEIVQDQSQVGSFIGEVLGFQFYQSLCKVAGNKNILSRCSFYGSKVIGEKLQTMFELGSSRPWYEAMSKVTGQAKLDGKSVTEYFEPLKKYLEQQNQS